MLHIYKKTDKTFKAGQYIIGDLCYIIDDEEWGDFLDAITYGETKEIQIEDKGTVKCFYDSTAYGDGCFPFGIAGEKYLIEDKTISSDCQLPVDAGIIGIISAEILDYYGIELPEGMILCEFSSDFNVDARNGDFDFGQLINVETSEETEEDGYDYI